MRQNLFLLAYPVRLGLKMQLKQENDDREELHLVGKMKQICFFMFRAFVMLQVR